MGTGKPRCLLDDKTVEQTEDVLDLACVIFNNLKRSKNIAKTVTKAHRRANLIIRCFMSPDTSSLVKAFKVYIRLILEYCSVVWCPCFMKDNYCTGMCRKAIYRATTRHEKCNILPATH